LYDPDFSDALIATARAAAHEAWAVRRVAALLLQRQFLLLRASDIAEHDRLFVCLGIKARAGLQVPLRESILDDGFSSRSLSDFIGEWRRNLSRSSGCLDAFDLPAAIARLERYAQSECKLPLARHLFTPEEVVAEILRGVRVSRGEELPVRRDAELIREEVDLWRQQLPAYESRILELLCDTGKIHWVAQQPVSELNALVEYPKGMVALVIKPPGSSVEFEIKRCGVPGPQPISAVFERKGVKVPDSHRLHAASTGWHLIFETRAAARFRRIYRLVHSVPPSVSIIHCVKSICSIPTPRGDCSIVDFFNFPDAYGQGAGEMRDGLKKCVKTAIDANDIGVNELPGEMGRTINFLIQNWPAQAIQSHTSSFRLDRLAAYLSHDGPKLYFQGARKISGDEMRWFADQLLDEILPGYAPAAGAFKSFGRYLDNVFSRSVNRRRANQLFVQLLQQLGAFWGTLAGIMGYSNGESLVARNVGLRALWSNGSWRVSLFFMDQDDLHLPDTTNRNLPVGRVMRGMLSDQRFCLGTGDQSSSTSCFLALAKIYRVSREVLVEGHLALRKARDAALQKTRRELKHNLALRDNFSPDFLRQVEECSRLCADFGKRRRELLAQPSLLEDFVRTQLPAGPDDDERGAQYVQALQDCQALFLLNPET
jgi:hypothetical protein